MDDDTLRRRVREVIGPLTPSSSNLRARIAASISQPRANPKMRLWSWAIALTALSLLVAIVGTAVNQSRLLRARPAEESAFPSPTPGETQVNVGAFKGQGSLAFISNARLYMLDGQAGVVRAVGDAVETLGAWSPSGHWLLFRRGQQPWLVAADGSAAHPLPIRGAAGWSPASDVLALIGTDGLWLIPTSGSSRRLVSATVGSFAWSLDGKMLAYTVSRPGAIDSVFTVEIESGLAQEVRLDLGRTRIYNNSTNNGITTIGWWADGQGLLIQRDPDHSASLAADGLPLESVPLQGGMVQTLAGLAPGSRVTQSRDGRLLVTQGLGRVVWENKKVAVCDVRTGECHDFQQPTGKVSLEPAWSTDNSRVAFVRADGGSSIPGFGPEAVTTWNRTRSLWVSDADGSHAREIRAAGTGVFGPMWSRDNRHILFMRDYSIWLLDLDGAKPVRIADGLFGGKLPTSSYGQANWLGQLTWFR